MANEFRFRPRRAVLKRRTVLLAPHLPLLEPAVIGGWILAPVHAHDWVDDRLADAVTRFLSKYTATANPPTVLARVDAPPGSTDFDRDDVAELQAALLFTGLNGNPDVTTQGWAASRALTSDNLTLEGWRIDPDDGWFSASRGSLINIQNAGLHIDDAASSLPVPLEITHPEPITLDTELASALLAELSNRDSPDHDRLITAISWFALAWRNTEVLTMAPRVVFLRTAFEALFPSSQPQSAVLVAQQLRQHFEKFADRVGMTVDTTDLMWSADETERYPRHRSPRRLTATEHWFRSFSDRRNEIVHEGSKAAGQYEGPAERFVGDYFWTGERLFRQTITTLLSKGDHPDLWQGPDARKVRGHVLQWLQNRDSER